MITLAAVAAGAAIPMAANADVVSLVTNGVTWRVTIDSSNGTATLGKDGCTTYKNADSYRACDVDTVATTDKIPWTFTHEGVDYTVTNVAAYAFYQAQGITGVLTIPDAVTTIGRNAFSSATGLTGLKGFGGVTVLGNYAFGDCGNIESEYPDLSRLTSIGESPFKNCSKMTGKLRLGESLSVIPQLAFAYSQFSGTAVVPAGVTTIGDQTTNNGAFEQNPNLSAIWVKGKPDAASQTYTTVHCAKLAASCSSMKMILMGKNTKGGRITQTGSNAMLADDRAVQVFVPANGYWDGLKIGGTNNKVWYYGATNEFNLAIDTEWMQATITPTTVNALTNALAWVPAFKTHFNLDAHISVTNTIDLTDVTITDDMVSGVTFDRLMFSAKTQTQLDAILGKFPVTTPISIDPTGLTENMTIPNDYPNVFVKTVPGVTIRRTASGFMIIVE